MTGAPVHDFLHYVPMLFAKGPNQGFDVSVNGIEFI
mgnify:CR=1 FL=1|jgi:hypothetical protein|tara:strand:+ start:5005 stop:5112 length:108 start_codon:yes stop_codon:yes gene_type:complete